MTLSQLTIYGAGLIGGSIALVARETGICERLVAVDLARPDSRPLQEVFDDWAVSPSEQDRALKQADLTVLCVPVRSVVGLLPSLLDRTSGTVTDCGSTKVAIVEAVKDHPERARFVAGHPMAGHPEGGLTNASQDMFARRRWILCPEGSSASALSVVETLVTATGAEIVHLSAPEHDASVAWTSHVPQVVASALSVHVHTHQAARAAGPGFASATRVAGGAEAMWSDIFGTNAHAIGNALLELGQALQGLGLELQAGNVEATLDLLAQARALRPPRN
ncbi:MAG TPA: prephenate dehydrogenase/arogenate dehydrogenase family protein [Polyangiaceae bacterium]|nr:prephenate dehydrogenase/arogenate dehydrogenase family protein [Polyangiaceae bacterium]